MVNVCRSATESFECTQVLPGCPTKTRKDSVSSSPSTSGLTVVGMHERTELMEDVAQLINSEWPRSMGARLAQLRVSSEQLPTSLLLLKNDLVVLGHLKLSPIGSQPNCCFVESVVISKDCRGQGLGTLLMRHAELYCMSRLGLNCIYLSTVDQVKFYSKLGYEECEPVNIYGNANFRRPNQVPAKKVYMKRSLVD